MAITITGDSAADTLLDTDPFALLVGMLLDQQVPMETAFAGPRKLHERLGHLDPARIAEADPEEFAAIVAEKPAVHRYPGSMAKRIQALSAHLVAEYDGNVTALWTDVDGATLLKRLKGLPGFGEQKAKIFLALLAKQKDVRPDGWEQASDPYGEPEARRSVADVVDATSLAEVRDFKKQMKAQAKKS